MRIFKRALCLALCFVTATFCFSGCSSGEKYDKKSVVLSREDKYEVVKNIDELIMDNKYRGTVAVKLNENYIYLDCTGSESKNGDDIEVTSAFQVGNLTEAFTTAAIMKLADEKKLSLEDSLTKFFNANVADVTVEDLVKNKVSFGYYIGDVEKDTKTLKKIDKLVKKDDNEKIKKVVADFIFNFGMVDYATDKSNYYLLGLIVEKASGEDYRDYVKKNIIDELGLKSTSFASSGKPYHGYDSENKKWLKTQTPRYKNWGFLFSVYGMESSQSDLFTFYDAFFSGKLFKTDVASYIAKSKSGNHYGFGFSKGDIDAWTSINLHRAYLHRDSDTDLTVLLLSNSVGGFDINTLGHEVYSAVNKKVTGTILRSNK